MMRPGLVLVLVAGLFFGACGADPEPATTPEPGAAASAPDKEALVGVLRDLLAAIEAGDTEKAMAYLMFPEGMSAEKRRKAVGGFVEKREISAAGIERLAAEGNFGLLDDVFGEAGRAWAKRSGVDIATCYALKLDDAQVAAFWDGATLKLIRLDDVGKLR